MSETTGVKAGKKFLQKIRSHPYARLHVKASSDLSHLRLQSIKKFVSVLYAIPVASDHTKELDRHPVLRFTLLEFVQRLVRKINLDTETVIAATILMQRVLERHEKVTTNIIGRHTLAMTCLLVASKLMLDNSFTNKSWCFATSESFTLKTVNTCELELLTILNFEVAVMPPEIEAFVESLTCDLR